MTELTRRSALRTMAGGAFFPPLAAAAIQQDPPRTDRDCVLGSGLTEAEADCWELTGRLAGRLLELPELHPMEKDEITAAIHIIQYRLLSRPTYRRYKELHGRLQEK